MIQLKNIIGTIAVCTRSFYPIITWINNKHLPTINPPEKLLNQIIENMSLLEYVTLNKRG